jgi:hypothetical protein
MKEYVKPPELANSYLNIAGLKSSINLLPFFELPNKYQMNVEICENLNGAINNQGV